MVDYAHEMQSMNFLRITNKPVRSTVAVSRPYQSWDVSFANDVSMLYLPVVRSSQLPCRLSPTPSCFSQAPARQVSVSHISQPRTPLPAPTVAPSRGHPPTNRAPSPPPSVWQPLAAGLSGPGVSAYNQCVAVDGPGRSVAS